MIRTLPVLSDLVRAADLPKELGLVADALAPVLDRVHYKRLRKVTVPLGDAGRIEVTLVSWERLGLSLGGAEGIAFVLQPDDALGTESEVALDLTWRWPVLKFAGAFSPRDLPTNPSGWAALLAETFGLDPRELVEAAIDAFFGSDTPEEEFADIFLASAGIVLNLPDSGDRTGALADQLAAIDSDVAGLLAEHIVARITETPEEALVGLLVMFERWLGSIDPADLIAFFVPEVHLRIRRVAAALEVPRSWLTPLEEDGSDRPEPARAQLRADLGSLSFSTSRGLRLDAPEGFSLPRARIHGTGLTVSVTGALPAFGIGPPPAAALKDGRGGEFTGIYVADAAIGLPTGWIADENSTAEFFVSDLILGTGKGDTAGLSGRIGLRGTGGTGGAHLTVRIGGESGVGLIFEEASILIRHNRLLEGTLAGGLEIPGLSDAAGQPTRLTMSVTLDDAGTWTVKTTGEVFLGEDIRLGPSGSAPVLRAEIGLGDVGLISFAVDGEMRLPSGDTPGGLRTVRVSGVLDVERGPGGAWRLTRMEAAGAAAGAGWTLPGGVVVEALTARISWSEAAGFIAEASGEVNLDEARLAVRGRVQMPDPADPGHVVLDGTLGLDTVTLGEAMRIFEGEVALHAATRPAPMGHVRLSGTAGLGPADGAGDALADYEVALGDFAAVLSLDAGGVALTVESGSLLLPEAFGVGGTAGARPAATIVPTEPIVLRSGPGGDPTLSGAALFTGLGVEIEDVFTAELTTARLTFVPGDLPLLTDVAGVLTVDLPGDESMVLALSDVSFDLKGLPVGQLALTEAVDIGLGGGFLLQIAGGADSSGIATGLTASRDAGGAAVVRIDASLALVVPVEALALSDGSTVSFSGAGHVVIRPEPSLALEAASLGGSFRIGGPDGLAVEDGLVTVTGIENLLSPSVAAPVRLSLTGRIQLPDDGPGFGLRGAEFILDGSDVPRFELQGIDVIPGEVLSAGDVLPITLSEARLDFVEPLPFPERLRPANLAITLSGAVQLPLGDGDGIGGQVENLQITFSEDGIPQLGIDGIGLGISGVELGVLEIGGEIYIGGLAEAASDPAALFFAGRVAGLLSNMGVKVVAAFRLTGPIGGCIDVSLGPAGIPLGQTGILLTGIAGGVSFANSNADPCDFRSYVQLGADGRPVATPDPDAPGPPAPAEDPLEEAPGGPAEMPPAEELAFPAPEPDCPPASMNILAEPHPDRIRYPNAVIYKFSALDETALKRIGITRDLVESWGLTDAASMGAAFAGALRAGIEGLWPPVPPGLTSVAEAAEAALDRIETVVALIATDAFAEVLNQAGGTEDVYGALLEIAWAGVPVADVTVKLTGTFSYVGVSSFLSVTGGIVLSTTGAAGLVGSLNLLGIPVGTFRGFVTATDAMGLPNPALCGEIAAAVGPLSLGTLRMSMSCPGGVTGIVGAVRDSFAGLGATVLRNALRRAAPRLAEGPAFDPANPAASLSLLNEDEAVTLVGEIASRPPADPATLATAMLGLIDGVWSNFNPEILLAGSVQPKLFGLPLAGEVVGVSAFATKTELAGQFRFSPSFIINYFLGGLMPLNDEATLGFRVSLPDPRQAWQAGARGTFADTGAMIAMMEDGLEHVLANATFTISYSIAPLGLEMADAQARMILPELDDHPDLRPDGWTPPEQRRGRSLPSRSDILQAAMRANVLGQPLWIGTADDLEALDPRAAGLDLRRDYFPHGGFVGAGYLSLPRLLVDPPPVQLAARVLDAAGDLPDRALALGELISDWIMTTVDVGEMSFAMPCASLPQAAGNLRETMAAMAAAEVPEAPGSLFPEEGAFVRGNVRGRLLGIPLGSAEVEAHGADPAAGRAAELRVRAEVPPGSWLDGFVGGASLSFTVTGMPARPVAETFGAFAAPAEEPARGGGIRPAEGIRRPGGLGLLLREVGRETPFAARRMTGGPRAAPRSAPTARPAPAPKPGTGPVRPGLQRAAAGVAHRSAATATSRARLDTRTDVLADRTALGAAAGRLVDGRPTASPKTAETTGGAPQGARDDPERRPQEPGAKPGASPLGEEVATLLAAINADLPKASLHLVVSKLRIPDQLAPLLTVSGDLSAELHAYSLAFDPRHDGKAQADRVRRNGGMVMTASFRIGAGFGLTMSASRIELGIEATSLFPTLSAELIGLTVGMPGGLAPVTKADVSLTIPGGGTGWQMGGADLRIAGDFLGAALTLGLETKTKSQRRLQGAASLVSVLDVTVGPLRAPGTSLVVVNEIDLDTKIDLDLTFSLGPAGQKITASGTFKWNKATWALPPTTIASGFATPEALAALIGQAIAARAETIFADFLGDPDAWAGAIVDGTIAFGGSLAWALFNAFDVAGDVAAGLLKSLGRTAAQIASDLSGFWSMAAGDIVTTLDALGHTAGEIASALRDGLALGRDAVAATLAGVWTEWSNIASALDAAFTMTASQFAGALAGAGAPASAVGAALDTHLTLTANSFAAALADAGFDADDVGAALRSQITTSASTAAAALRAAGYTSTEVAEALHEHFTKSISTAASALATAGYGATTVAMRLADVFGGTLRQVANALLDTFDISVAALGNALKAAGFDAAAIAAFTASLLGG